MKKVASVLFGFIKKHKIWCSVCLVLILTLIPLSLTVPTEEKLAAHVSAEFLELEAKNESAVYKDGGFMSCYIATKQVSATRAEREAYLGIAGQVLNADDGVTEFLANSLTWIGPLMGGAEITILLTLASVVSGIVISIFLALGKMSKFKPVSLFCRAYIFFFRGTPLLMQLFFIWFGLPKISPMLTIKDQFVAAWIAFSLNSGAYCAEIIRAAIESIDKGQFEAAKALGLSYGKTMRKIIIPQTYRRLIPPLANEFIMVLKDASITSIIALKDLSKVTSTILTSSGEVSVFILSMAIYLIITAVFSKVFNVLEKKFSVYE